MNTKAHYGYKPSNSEQALLSYYYQRMFSEEQLDKEQ